MLQNEGTTMRGRLIAAIGVPLLLVSVVVVTRVTHFPVGAVFALGVTVALGLVSTLLSDLISRLWLTTVGRRWGPRVDIARYCVHDRKGLLPRVRDVEELALLGVQLSPGRRDLRAPRSEPPHARYRMGKIDEHIDAATSDGGLVILVGPAGCGKSRAAYEAIRRRFPRRFIVAPRHARHLAALTELHVPYRQAVVWLDRLERYLADGDLDVYTLVRRCPQGRRPGVIVATLRTEEYERLGSGSSGIASEVLERATIVRLPARPDTASGSTTTAASAPNRTARWRGGLPPLPACLDRETHVAEVIAAVCEVPSRPIAVLGPPGIGKSTIIRKAMHDERVVVRFGTRRAFVRCRGAALANATIADLAKLTGQPLGPRQLDEVLSSLAEAPSLLVLDDIGLTWERDPVATEELLETLAGVPGLALVASVRGGAVLPGVSWEHTLRVAPLDHATGRALFLASAGAEHHTDRHLDDLVSAQDGMPLALRLLGAVANGEPSLAGLWRRWMAQHGAVLVQQPGGYDRLDASFALSLNSPQMNPTALRLLSVLSALPDGVEADDLLRIMPTTGDAAAATLRRVGLAFDELGRLRSLAPVRDYVGRNRPIAERDLDNLIRHYAELAITLGNHVGTTDGERASTRLVAESGNLAQLLPRGLAGHDPVPAIRAVCALGEFTRYTGVGEPSLLTDAASAAVRVGDLDLEGECHYRLGDIALRRSNAGEAVTHLQRALSLFEASGNVAWQGRTVKHLGDAAFEQCNYSAAETHFDRADALYSSVADRSGRAHCVKCRGDVAQRRSFSTRAQDLYTKALNELTELGDTIGQADCLRRLGDADLSLGAVDSAAVRFRVAEEMYTTAGATLGRANCILGRARVALAAGDHPTARDLAQVAAASYVRMAYVRGQAQCIEVLAHVALALDAAPEAIEHFRCALSLFDATADLIGVASCHLGIAHAVDTLVDRDAAEDIPDAHASATAALEIFERVDSPLGIGYAQERLARSDTLDPRTTALRSAARDAFTRIDRHDLVDMIDRPTGRPMPPWKPGG